MRRVLSRERLTSCRVLIALGPGCLELLLWPLRTSRNRGAELVAASVRGCKQQQHGHLLKPPAIRRSHIFTAIVSKERSRRRRRHPRPQLQTDRLSSIALRCRHPLPASPVPSHASTPVPPRPSSHLSVDLSSAETRIPRVAPSSSSSSSSSPCLHRASE